MSKEEGQIQTVEKAPLARAKPEQQMRDYLLAAKGRIEEIAPKHLTADRLVRLATLAVSRSPQLLACTPQSVLVSVMEASRLGLEIGGCLGEAYLVPFKNNKNGGVMEAQFIPGYQGLLKLVYQTGQIKAIVFGVVREGDLFVPPRKKADKDGLVTTFEHEERAPSSAQRTHVYAVAQMMNGGIASVCLTAQQMREHVDRIPAAKFGMSVWQSKVPADLDAMWIKTALRRLCKYLPKSAELADAIEASAKDEYESESEIFDATAFQDQPVKQTRARQVANRIGIKTADEIVAPPAEQETVNTETGEVSQDTQPAAQDEAQGPAKGSFDEWRIGMWELAEQLGSGSVPFQTAIQTGLKLGGFLGKESKATAEWKGKMAKALQDKNGVFAYLAG